AAAVQLHGLPRPGRLRHAGRCGSHRGGAARLQGRGGLRRLERYLGRRRAEGPDELRQAWGRGPHACVLDQVARVSVELEAGYRQAMAAKKSKSEVADATTSGNATQATTLYHTLKGDIIRG